MLGNVTSIVVSVALPFFKIMKSRMNVGFWPALVITFMSMLNTIAVAMEAPPVKRVWMGLVQYEFLLTQLPNTAKLLSPAEC